VPVITFWEFYDQVEFVRELSMLEGMKLLALLVQNQAVKERKDFLRKKQPKFTCDTTHK
jgi:hypothetical protein